MNKKNIITTLFLDIGGVLLTDGWDRTSRKNAAFIFDIDHDAMEERHHLTFDTYELGKISLEEYLKRVVFYADRSFSYDAFKEFMYAQSKPFPEMIKIISQLKKQYGLKVAVVSNEGRELNDIRIKNFRLHDFVDFFISSCFVHLQKPDMEIFRMALDMSQAAPEQVLYIDDQPMFVELAQSLGMNGIHHTDIESTVEKLKEFGLQNANALQL
jgi:putative hydrolase of the HAD superfamily